MDKLTHIKPAKSIRGTIAVPPDKSISHRAALVSLLSKKPVTIHNYLSAGDTLATLAAIQTYGAKTKLQNTTAQISGVGLNPNTKPQNIINAQNSGTLIRIILGIAAGLGHFACFTGDESLRGRPMKRVVGPLREMGAEIAGVDGGQRLPIAMLGNGSGLRGGEYAIPVASAQIKSCILFAGLFADSLTEVVEPGKSRDHTERLLRACGVGIDVEDLPGGSRKVGLQPPELLDVPAEMIVPGDISSAAFWISAALVIPGSEVKIRGVGLNPTRTGFLGILDKMGAEIEVTEVWEDALGEPVGGLVARHSSLRGVRVSGEEVPAAVDELPLLAMLGTFAEGETVLGGAAELRVKETDRISAVCEEFRKIGGDIEEREDGFAVAGSGGLRGGEAGSRGDHRLAMGLAVAGLSSEKGVGIEDVEASTVSYPGFLEDLESLSCW